MKPELKIDKALCVHCAECVKDCVCHIIVLGPDGVPSIPNAPEEGCLECQHCLAVCPTGALSIFDLDPKESIPLKKERLPSGEQMHVLLRGRRSVRRFLDEPISAEELAPLLATVAHAPTGCNARALIFSVVEGRAAVVRLIEKINLLIDRAEKERELPGFVKMLRDQYRKNNVDDLFRGAPYILIAAPGENAVCGPEDAVIALSYFELLAQTNNIGTTWCGYLPMLLRHLPEARPLFGLAPDQYFYAMVFGRPAVRYARTTQKETAAEIRKLEF